MSSKLKRVMTEHPRPSTGDEDGLRAQLRAGVGVDTLANKTEGKTALFVACLDEGISSYYPPNTRLSG
jgi:hypothetical protein